jgi:hypothetical protein
MSLKFLVTLRHALTLKHLPWNTPCILAFPEVTIALYEVTQVQHKLLGFMQKH